MVNGFLNVVFRQHPFTTFAKNIDNGLDFG